MEFVEKKYKRSVIALKTLEKIIEEYKIIDPKYHEMCRDALIQRFEYSFDALWMYVKVYLESVCSVALEVKGSRHVFREALRAGLITQEQVEIAFKMIDLRNLTSHAYDQEVADKVAREIPGFYSLMVDFLKIMDPSKKK